MVAMPESGTIMMGMPDCSTIVGSVVVRGQAEQNTIAVRLFTACASAMEAPLAKVHPEIENGIISMVPTAETMSGDARDQLAKTVAFKSLKPTEPEPESSTINTTRTANTRG